MLTQRRGLGVATLDGVLYVVGGSDGIGALNQVFLHLLDFHFSFLSGFDVLFISQLWKDLYSPVVNLNFTGSLKESYTITLQATYNCSLVTLQVSYKGWITLL